MHELSVCQSLLSQVLSIAQEHDARAVATVRLRIGPLSGVDPELLQSAFPLATAGTLAARAELITELLPVRVRCDGCGAESAAQINKLLCARCGDWHTRVVSGDELLLASVELDV